MVTFTLSAQLRPLASSSQKEIYGLMFKTSSQALKELIVSPRFLGGSIGMTGLLHTHSRRLDYHPHIHYIVPAGALLPKGKLWKKNASKFVVPQKPLGRLFRGKFLSELDSNNLFYSKCLHRLDWVVNIQHIDKGEPALKYLSRYLYRGVISEKNIISEKDGQISPLYRK